jgi:hypothetical protein
MNRFAEWPVLPTDGITSALMHAVTTNCYDLVALLFAPTTHTATQESKARMRGLNTDATTNHGQRRGPRLRATGNTRILGQVIDNADEHNQSDGNDEQNDDDEDESTPNTVVSNTRKRGAGRSKTAAVKKTKSVCKDGMVKTADKHLSKLKVSS